MNFGLSGAKFSTQYPNVPKINDAQLSDFILFPFLNNNNQGFDNGKLKQFGG